MTRTSLGIAREVWRFPIIGTSMTVQMPEGAVLLGVHPAGDEAFSIYAEVYPGFSQRAARTFHVIGTGHFIAPGLVYVGTFKVQALVLHVYEEPR